MKLKNQQMLKSITIEVKACYIYIIILQGHNICTVRIEIKFWYKIINNF